MVKSSIKSFPAKKAKIITSLLLMNGIGASQYGGDAMNSSNEAFIFSEESSAEQSRHLLRIPSSFTGLKQRLRLYDQQVGGHTEFVKPDDSEFLFKPYDKSEFTFYSLLQTERFKDLLPFTARCYGEVELEDGSVHSSDSSQDATPGSTNGKSSKYVMLEDLAHGLQRPCILDLKMGLMQRSQSNSSEAKLAKARSKSLSTTSHVLGMRVCGVVYHDVNSGERVYRDKYHGRSLGVSQTYQTIVSFFQSVKCSETRQSLIAIFVEKVKALRTVIARLAGIRFWSGSLLLVFDADSPAAATLKMIDFAQTAVLPEDPVSPPDLEYLYGIDSLLAFLQSAKSGAENPPALTGRDRPDTRLQTEELLSLTRA